jgi:hypothetical protein
MRFQRVVHFAVVGLGLAATPAFGMHYDGAKAEETIIQVWGMGPATSTPAQKR